MNPLEMSGERKYGPRTYQWWWEALVDWMIANPGKPVYHAATEFGKSVNYIYAVTSSDMFKERYNERRAAIAQGLNEQILEKTARVAVKGLDLIHDRLASQDVSKTKLETLTEVTDSALKALGYGVPRGPSVVVNNNNSAQVIETAASPATLLEARKRIRETQAPVIEGEIVEDPAQPSLPLDEEEVSETLIQAPPPVEGASSSPDIGLFDDEDGVTLVHEELPRAT